MARTERTPEPGLANDRLYEIINEYLEARRHGRAPARGELLERHPELAPDIEEFLDNYESFGVIRNGAGRIGGGDMGGGDARAALTLAPGARIGDYEIIEELGRGGMGVVFKARQASLRRTVALKLILAGRLASEVEVRRFRREAEAAAALEHPRIVSIYEIGEHDGLHYFSMRYVEGEPLSRRSVRGSKDPRWIATLVASTSRAVEYAHARGVLHRDLKPSNVLIDAEGHPHVLDFGLAKILSGGGDLTLSGTMVGTPSYMAPEQAVSNEGRDTPATDVYSLGAILYELLTERPPFAGKTSLEILDNVRRRDPLRPRTVDSEVPLDLETICLRCLEKDPRRRYRSAGELADDLERYLGGRPIRARPVSPLERFWKTCRRNPVVASLVTGIILSLTVLSLGLSVANLKMRESLWQSYVDQGRALRLSGRPGQRFGALESLRKAAEIRSIPVLRDEVVASLGLIDVREVYRARLDGRELVRARAVATDSGLGRVAYYVPDQGAVVLERGRDHAFPMPPVSETGWWGLRFSPDGRFLSIVERSGRHRVWELGSGSSPRLEVQGFHSGDFRSDGSEIAIGRQDGSVTIHDLSSGREARRLRPPHQLGSIALVSYRPDDEALAVVGDRRTTVQTWDLGTGSVLDGCGGFVNIGALAWHPSGLWLAVASQNSIDLLLGGRREKTLRGHHAAVKFIAFHPSGDFLASSGWDDSLKIWNVDDGEEVLRLEGQRVLRFSGDGRYFATYDGSGDYVVWSFVDAPEWRTLGRYPVDSHYVHSFALRSAACPLVAGTKQETLFLDPASGRRLGALPTGDTKTVLLTPDGAALLTWGAKGLQRWPVSEDPPGGSTRRIRVGPPIDLGLYPAQRFGTAAMSRDGTTIAAVVDEYPGRVAVLRKPEAEPQVLETKRWLIMVAVSPEGRLAAGAGVDSGWVVWDLATGREVHGSPLRFDGGTWVGFCERDDRLVVGQSTEFVVWDTRRWQPIEELSQNWVPRPHAWLSRPADLLVRRLGAGRLEFRDLRGRRTLLRVETPSPRVLVPCLDESGRYLATFGAGSSIRVLDLSAVGEHLRRFDVPWELATPVPSPVDERPFEVHVEPGGGQ